ALAPNSASFAWVRRGKVDKNINRRIYGKSDDIGHKRRPIQYWLLRTSEIALPSKHRYFPVAITGLAFRIIARNRRGPSEFHLFARCVAYLALPRLMAD